MLITFHTCGEGSVPQVHSLDFYNGWEKNLKKLLIYLTITTNLSQYGIYTHM